MAHCLQNISLVEDISNDKITQEGELFLVKSSKSGETYRVNFGSDEVLPSCFCYDWKKNLMLCKHMMAVMRCCKDIHPIQDGAGAKKVPPLPIFPCNFYKRKN